MTGAPWRIGGVVVDEPVLPRTTGTTDRVGRFYETQADEDTRLSSSPAFRLEVVRTRSLLGSRLPAPPARIVDVGGGTGAYAVWLRDLGHDVVLVDLVADHVELARSRGIEAVVADARTMDLPASSSDAVLLMGPLYHLPDAADRAAVLARAAEVVRPGGLIVVAAINRWTPLVHLASIGAWDDGMGAWDDDVVRRLVAGVRSGVHDHRVSFTTAYLHRPDELAREVADAGFDDVEVVPVEGPLGPIVDHLPDPDEAVRRAVRVAETTEREPALSGASQHLLAFARRPAE